MKKMSVKKKIERKNNFIYNSFIESLFYLRKNYIYFIIAIVLMLIGSLAGYFGVVGMFSPALEKTINQFVSESVAEIVKETETLNPVELTFFIMNNNIKTAFMGLVSGIFLAVSPIVIIIFNGYVLGFVAEVAVNSSRNPEGIFVLWRLLPHGIFEIPAILLSIGLGIKLGLYPFQLKEKLKGISSLIVSIVIFLFLSGMILMIISSVLSPEVLTSNNLIKSNDFSKKMFDNPIISILLYIVLGLCFFISFYAGHLVLSLKDRIIFKNIIKNSLKVFVFIIIPLLVIAGLIEGLLIYLVG